MDDMVGRKLHVARTLGVIAGQAIRYQRRFFAAEVTESAGLPKPLGTIEPPYSDSKEGP